MRRYLTQYNTYVVWRLEDLTEDPGRLCGSQRKGIFMAAVVITGNDVRLVGGGILARTNRTYGEAVTPVMPVYQLTGQYFKADCTTGSKAEVRGITLINGDLNGPSILVPNGSKLNLGAVLTQGLPYYVGATAGTLVPYTDLVSGNYVTRVGFAESSSVLRVDIDITGITVP